MPVTNGNMGRSDDVPGETPAGDYLKRDVIERANAVLWRRKEAARKKRNVWTKPKDKS